MAGSSSVVISPLLAKRIRINAMMKKNGAKNIRDGYPNVSIARPDSGGAMMFAACEKK